MDQYAIGIEVMGLRLKVVYIIVKSTFFDADDFTVMPGVAFIRFSPATEFIATISCKIQQIVKVRAPE